VKLPHLVPEDPEPELVFCPLDQQPLPLAYSVTDGQFHYSGDYSARLRDPGSDVAVCFGGAIAVTRLSLAQV
jgi:5'-nucleotidase